ncbi:short-chain dehydrogenase/reductase [Mycobacterium antarcticum]|uniref:SDR family NAD(P)-dependent oxidoreductase n=1 Tax=Mycolicibacterium sp. TUM20985 TaxID=3023370 RepID=UPI002572738B|nr:SDR family NAD(P)-dependent oxidoreductase [Mycolicibacterium sp. TUM20985]BDX35270.1 short-chain dehydrogenase/reductase [Mycolicibacterium sp. TUM20985]
MALSPRTWFITGSSRGLGRALAQAALLLGDNVVATARDTASLANLVAQHGGRVLPVRLDVADPHAAIAAVRAATARFGRLDVVVNNAGYANFGSFEDIPSDDFRAQVETNLFGVINVTRAVVPLLRTQGNGHIVNVSSLGGRLAGAGLTAYQLSKWAVSGFSVGLAAELAPLGIHVTAIEPGGIRTDWAGDSMQVLPISEPYRATLDRFANVRGSVRQASDPAKVAAAILTIVELDDPPTRILLGSDAVTIAAVAEAAQRDSDTRYRELSRSTDADDVTAAELDPLNIAAGAASTVAS